MARTTSGSGRTAAWPSTLWELIHRVREGSGRERSAALETLLGLYYRPVRRFFQRALRAGAQQADDLTQEFFTRFIERDFLRGVTREENFRGFLKVACRRHFITWLESRAARPIPRLPAPERLEPAVDEEFRAWYLDEALRLTQEALKAEGKDAALAVFEARVQVDGSSPEEYKSIADRLGLRVYDVRNLLVHARRVFRRELLRLAKDRADDPKLELAELGLLAYLPES